MTISSTETVTTTSDSASTGRGMRRRGACTLLGAAYFLVAFFGGGLIGLLVHLLVETLVGRQHESWSRFAYEAPAIVLYVLVLGVAVGGWMGMRSYRPAALVAGGKQPEMPFFAQTLHNSRRGPGAILAIYFVPRWKLLIGQTDGQWRILPRVLAGAVLVAPFLLVYFVGRDADFRISIWVCGGLAVVLADCLLVNKIVRWRVNRKLKPL